MIAGSYNARATFRKSSVEHTKHNEASGLPSNKVASQIEKEKVCEGMQNFLDKLKEQSFIAVDNVEILQHPTDFFNALKTHLRKAEEVYIVCLYIGTGEYTTEILDEIRERVQKKMLTKMLLDTNRMHRTPALLKMLQKKGIDKEISFFDPSSKILVLPKLKELLSVFHSKIFVFDDVTILTGANIHDSYMKDRLDRYIVVRSKELVSELKYAFYQYLDGKRIPSCGTVRKHLNDETQVCVYYQDKEYEVLRSIVESNFGSITLATSYLNFPESYCELFKGVDIKIITASPETSTYTEERVFEKNVNEAYSLFSMRIQKCLPQATMYEFVGESLSFHCKGLWAFSDDFACFICGSSNFNVRSAERDIETNFLIVTRNKGIIDAFRAEHDNMMAQCTKRSQKDLSSRKVSLVTKNIAFILQRFL